MNINLNICNVTITGLAFFFLFAAFQTASLTAQNVLEAVSKQRNNSFDGTGYTSQIVGGLYAYLSLSNIDEISRTLRIRLYGGLLGCAIFGILLLFTLRKPHKTDNISHQQLINMEMNSSGDNLSELTPDYSTIQNRSTVFQSTLHSLRINLTFYSSLYASALGHCLHFGRNAKSYIGLAGLFIGIGEIVGSFSSHLTRWIRLEGVLVIFGYISAIVAGYFTFMMLPTNSSIKDTDELSYITPKQVQIKFTIVFSCLFVYLAMLIAFLFGGVDSVWNTQISTLIGFIYGEHGRDVTVGFALFKSVQEFSSIFVHSQATTIQLLYTSSKQSITSYPLC
uniref:UNC93-like protein MFSD11 n=1 Tax=Schistosoma haematobium TaxID=6185 RepID=A0A094ZZA5_SCHHA